MHQSPRLMHESCRSNICMTEGIDHSLLSDEIQNVYNYCSAMCQLSSKVGRILSSDSTEAEG
jgi:hypothetical protein